MLTGFLALAILIMRLFPDIPLARSLHLYLVDLPVRLANRLERRHILLAGIFLFSIQSFAMIGAADLAIVYAAEMSLYADAALATYLAMLATRLRNFRTMCMRVVCRIARSRPRPRRRRNKTAATRRPKKAANDDHPARERLAEAA